MKKLLAVLLSVVLLIGVLPVGVLAADWTGSGAPTVTLSATDPDADGNLSVTVHVGASDKLIAKYSLAIEYDQRQVAVNYDMGNIEDDFGPTGLSLVSEADSTFRARNLTINQTREHLTDTDKLLFNITDAYYNKNPRTGAEVAITDKGFDATCFFTLTDDIKESGGMVEFKLSDLVYGSGNAKTQMFMIGTNDDDFAVYPETGNTVTVAVPISAATVSGTVTTPAKGVTDATGLSVASEYLTVETAWTPALTNNTFAANTEYTLTVTVEPAQGALLSDSFAVTGPAEGFTYAKQADGSYQATKTFPRTADKVLTGIGAALKDPNKSYVDGDTVAAADITVTAAYDEGPNAEYTNYEIVYASGSALTKGDTSVTVRSKDDASKTAVLEFPAVQGRPGLAEALTIQNPIVLPYNGTDQCEAIIQSINRQQGTLLTPGQDFLLDYMFIMGGERQQNVTNAGTYYVYVTVQGDAHYADLDSTKIATAVITPLAVTVTPDAGQKKEFGAAEPTLTYTVQPALLEGDGFTGALAREPGDDYGTYAITQGTLSAGGNYAITFTTGVTFAITKTQAKVTTAPTAASNLTYSGQAQALVNAGVAEGGELRYSLDGQTYSPALPTGTNAGTYTVWYKAEGDANHDSSGAVKIENIVIAPKTVTAAVEVEEVPYNGQSQEPAELSFGNDTLVAQTDYTVAYSNNKNAGTASVTVSPVEGSNYSFTAVTETFTITPKAVTITGLSAVNKTYDGTTDATVSGTAVIDGKVPNDELSVKAGTAAFADQNAGTGKTVSFSGYALEGAAKDNYTLSAQPAAVTADIAPKAVTITGLSAENKTYDGTTAATVSGTAVIDGKVSNDELSVKAGTAAFADQNAGTGKTVSFSGYALEGAAKDNYTLSAQPAAVTADITPKTVTVTANARSKAYGDADPELTYRVTGLVGNDQLTGSLTRVTGEDVDDYAIQQGTLRADGNYVVSYTGANLTITKAAFVGTLTGSITVPTGKAKEGTYSLSGLRNWSANFKNVIISSISTPQGTGNTALTVERTSDDSFRYSTAAGAALDEQWTFAVTFSSKNYTDTTATITVTAKDINLPDGFWTDNVQTKEVVYGTANKDAFATLSRNGTAYDPDNHPLQGVFSVVEPDAVQAAGTGSVTVRFTVTAEGDYRDATVEESFPFSITKRPVTAVWELGTYTYDGTAHAPSATAAGIGETTLTLDVSGAESDAGTHTAAAALNTADAANYTLNESGSAQSYTVAPMEIGLSWGDAEFTYDGAPHAPTAEAVGLVGSDSCAVLVSGAQTDAGTYTATANALDNPNYALPAAATQSFTIKPYDLGQRQNDAYAHPFTLTEGTFGYDGSEKRPAPTAPAELGFGAVTLTEDADYTVTWSSNVNAGDQAAVIVNGKGNYTGKQTLYFTITPEELGNDNLQVDDLVYTGKAQTPTLRFVDGETPLNLRKNTDYTVEPVSATTVDSYSVTVEFIGNYSGTATQSFQVTPKALSAANATLSLSAVSFVYNGQMQVPQITVMESGLSVSEADYSVRYLQTDGEGQEHEVSAPTDAGAYLLAVEFRGNYSGSLRASFTIGRAERSLRLTQSSLALKVKATANVSALGLIDNAGSEAVYEFAASGAVTVEEGVITAGETAGSGSLTITAPVTANYNMASLTVPVTVTELEARRVSFETAGSLSVPFGTENAANAAGLSAGTGELRYTSSNPDVATVDAEGVLTLHSAGKATVTASVAADEQYAAASNSYELTVEPKTLGSGDVTVTLTLPEGGYTYDNTAKRPAAEVKLGEELLAAGADYSLSYSANVNAGSAKVTVRFAGNYTGSVEQTFEIKKASRGTVTVPDDIILTVKGASASVQPTGLNDLDGSAARATKYEKTGSGFQLGSTGTVVAEENGSGTVTVTIGATDNYEAAEAKTANVRVMVQEITGLTVRENGNPSTNLTAVLENGKLSVNGVIADSAAAPNITVEIAYFDMENGVADTKTVTVKPSVDAAGAVTLAEDSDKTLSINGKDYTVSVEGLKAPPIKTEVQNPKTEVDESQSFYQELTDEQAKELEQVLVQPDKADLSGALAGQSADQTEVQNALDQAKADADKDTDWMQEEDQSQSQAQNYELVEVWSMKVEVRDYQPEAQDGAARLKLDIAPTSSIVARETENGQPKADGRQTTLQKREHHTVANPIGFQIQLPNGFPTAGLYVRHWISPAAYGQMTALERAVVKMLGGRYYEDIIPARTGRLLSLYSRFFSDFEIIADGREVEAVIRQPDGTTVTKTLTTASEDAGELLLTGADPNKRFDGWVVSNTALDDISAEAVTSAETALSKTNGLLDELIANKDGNGKVYLYAKTTAVWHITVNTVAPLSDIQGLRSEGYEDGAKVVLIARTDDASYTFNAWDTSALSGGFTVNGATLTIDSIASDLIVGADYTRVSTGGGGGGGGAAGGAGEAGETEEIEAIFEDVQDETAYYYDAVYWAVKQGITTGKDAEHFDPAGDCTRAQMVTFLWRYSGSPEPAGSRSPFEDVQDPEAYYYKAVLWAVERGITKGVDETHFAPEDTVNRAQSATFLYRMAKGAVAAGAVNPFEDVAQEDYYYESVVWAAVNGVTKGVDDTHFDGVSDCIRGQVVTFLYRLDQLNAKE